MELKNKVAIVNGRKKGIGRANAKALAKEGKNVAIYARDGETLEKTAAEVKAQGVDVFSFTGNMSAEAEIKQFIEATINRFGQLDVLINNAGVGLFHRIADFPTKD